MTESRAIVDAVTPTPESFARATGCSPPPRPSSSGTSSSPLSNANAALPELRRSIREHFPGARCLATSDDRQDPSSIQQRYHVIHNLCDLQVAVLTARSSRKQVRASTTGLNSTTNHQFLSQGHHVLDMTFLSRIEYIAGRGVVVAQAGVTPTRLIQVLERNEVVLPVNMRNTCETRSIGGAFVMGIGGNAYRSEVASLADIAIEVSVVDAFGRLRVFSKATNPHIFAALRLSLGLFGIVYDVTLKVVQNPRALIVSNSFTTFGALLKKRGVALRRMLTVHAGVELVWFPFNSYSPDAQWMPSEDHIWIRIIDHVSTFATIKMALEKTPPPFIRLLTMPQWLSLNVKALANVGYQRFEGNHAPLYIADAFRQSAWVLAAKRRVSRVEDVANYRFFDGACATVSVTIAIPVRMRQRSSPHSSTDTANTSATAETDMEMETGTETETDTDTDTDTETETETEIEIENNRASYREGESTSHEGTTASRKVLLSVGDDNVGSMDGASLCRSVTESDGWSGVHAAIFTAAQRMRAVSVKMSAAIGTTRVFIRMKRASDAILSPCRGSNGSEAMVAVITLEGARNVPMWDELACDVLRVWALIPGARWVWSRQAAQLVTRAGVAVARRLRVQDAALERFLALRHLAAVDDYGMFVDHRLDDVVEGAFSRPFRHSAKRRTQAASQHGDARNCDKGADGYTINDDNDNNNNNNNNNSNCDAEDENKDEGASDGDGVDDDGDDGGDYSGVDDDGDDDDDEDEDDRNGDEGDTTPAQGDGRPPQLALAASLERRSQIPYSQGPPSGKSAWRRWQQLDSLQREERCVPSNGADPSSLIGATTALASGVAGGTNDTNDSNDTNCSGENYRLKQGGSRKRCMVRFESSMRRRARGKEQSTVSSTPKLTPITAFDALGPTETHSASGLKRDDDNAVEALSSDLPARLARPCQHFCLFWYIAFSCALWLLLLFGRAALKRIGVW